MMRLLKVNESCYKYTTATAAQRIYKERKCVKITYNTQSTTVQLANVVALAARCVASTSLTPTQSLLPRQPSIVALVVPAANCLPSLSAKPPQFNKLRGASPTHSEQENIMQFKSRVAGIPCIIDVTGAKWHRGQGRNAPSDWDAQDHFECEFEVLDRRGYAAPWLTQKLTAQIISDIEHDIAGRV